VDVVTRWCDAARGGAQRLGVFAALAAGSQDAEAMAARLGCKPRRLRALLDVLAATGDLARASSPSATEAPGARLVAEVIARDRPLGAADGEALRREARALPVGPLLGERTGLPKHELAALIAPELDADATFLDAGGGLGDVSAEIARLLPAVRVVLVDLPAVAAAATRRLGRAVSVLAGDLRRAPLPAARVALLGNVLHMHGPEGAAGIVAAVATAVSAGGLLVAKDLDRTTLPGLLFNLGAALYADDGEVHDEARVTAWLTAAGLAVERRVVLPFAPEAYVLCARQC